MKMKWVNARRMDGTILGRTLPRESFKASGETRKEERIEGGTYKDRANKKWEIIHLSQYSEKKVASSFRYFFLIGGKWRAVQECRRIQEGWVVSKEGCFLPRSICGGVKKEDKGDGARKEQKTKAKKSQKTRKRKRPGPLPRQRGSTKEEETVPRKH